jgi:hypothetical protein
MSSAPYEKELFAHPIPNPGTVFVNDRVCVQTEEDQRVISVHSVVFSHYSIKDRVAETYAMVLLFESGYADQKSFGHAHHVYYQIACIFAVLGRREEAFEWLERSVSSGFACWPFFLKDACLQNLLSLPEFEVLVSSLQAKYPDHLGLL